MVFGDYIPARTLLNLRAGYQIGKATFALSAENLLGKKYFTGWMDGVAGRMVDVHPRTAMLRMTVVTD
jgi:outer membrane receptor protein involved in Fe transport